MRYIFYIAAFLVLSSSFMAYLLLSDRPSKKDAALVINDRVITREEFAGLYAAREPHLKEKSDFVSALITKELLIQEAKKLGIDREESFRKSIQSFYEQSLIKILIDRKLASLSVSVSDEDLQRYLDLLNRRMHVTAFTFENREAADRNTYISSEKRILDFKDLSRDLKEALMSLKTGEKTAPIKMGRNLVVFRLDGSTLISPPEFSSAEAAKIREMLIDEKREKILDEWIENLNRSCTVTNQLEQGSRQ